MPTLPEQLPPGMAPLPTGGDVYVPDIGVIPSEPPADISPTEMAGAKASYNTLDLLPPAAEATDRDTITYTPNTPGMQEALRRQEAATSVGVEAQDKHAQRLMGSMAQDARLATELAARDTEHATRMEKLQAESAAAVSRATSAYEQQVAAYEAAEPQDFWASRGTEAKIQGAIAIMLGAYSQGLTGSQVNPGWQALQQTIERDAAQQKMKQEKLKDLVGMRQTGINLAQEQGKYAVGMEDAYHVAATARVKNLLDAASRQTSNANVLAGIEQKKAELQQRGAELYMAGQEKLAGTVKAAYDTKTGQLAATLGQEKQQAAVNAYVAQVEAAKQGKAEFPVAVDPDVAAVLAAPQITTGRQTNIIRNLQPLADKKMEGATSLARGIDRLKELKDNPTMFVAEANTLLRELNGSGQMSDGDFEALSLELQPTIAKIAYPFGKAIQDGGLGVMGTAVTGLMTGGPTVGLAAGGAALGLTLAGPAAKAWDLITDPQGIRWNREAGIEPFLAKMESKRQEKLDTAEITNDIITLVEKHKIAPDAARQIAERRFHEKRAAALKAGTRQKPGVPDGKPTQLGERLRKRAEQD